MMNYAGVQAADADGIGNGIPKYKIDYQKRREYHREYQKRKRANRSGEERKKMSEYQLQYCQRKNDKHGINKSRNAIQFNNHQSNIQGCIEQSCVRDSRTINHLNNKLLVNVLENERAGKALREIHIRELERQNQDIETHQKQYTIFVQEWGWQME